MTGFKCPKSRAFSRLTWLMMLSTALLARDTLSEWFPMTIGNVWVYEHEVRNGNSTHPQIWRWETVETVTGSLTIPEGQVILRHVDVKGDTGGSWLARVYGQGNYLIRDSCLYFIDPQSWDEQKRRLKPFYLAQVLAGNSQPEFCFPLQVGKSFGKDLRPGWIASRVIKRGPDHRFKNPSIIKNSFDVLTHVDSGDETHLWFEKGVGLTGIFDRHNGTYFEYHDQLQRFQPAVKNGKTLVSRPPQ